MSADKDKRVDKKKDIAKTPKKMPGLFRYFKEVVGEVKKLTWPTRKELVNYTLTVIAFVLAMATVIGVLDVIFSWGLGWLTSL